MKKRIFAVLMTLLCVSLVFALASCGGDDGTDEPTECTEHTFGEWETDVYGSCTQDGLKFRTCTVCGFEEEQVVEAGHKWTEWETVTELTCTQHGLKTRVCTVCDWKEEDKKEAQGHTWGEEPSEVVQEGSCTEDRIVKYACTAEGCEETKEETTEALGHNWTEWGYDLDGEPLAKTATCTEEGYIGRECIECGEGEYEYTPKKDHSWNDWVVVGTCADGATRTRGCANCDAVEEETTQPGEHANVVYLGAKEAKIGEDGSTGVKKCLACDTVLEGAKIIRIFNLALGGKVSTTSDFWASSKEYQLNTIVDGNRETGLCSHPKYPNTIETIEFTVAGKVEQIILVVNGKGKTEAASHAEVTNNEYDISFTLFNEAGEVVYVSENFNTLDKIEIVVDVELLEGDTVKTMEIKRSTKYATDRNLWEVYAYTTLYLNACEANGHTWGAETRVEPTCSNEALTDGYVTKSCTVCGTVDTQVLTATHAWTEWDVTNFSCTEGGTMTRSCTSCGKEESQTTEGGEHGEVELQNAKEATLEAEGYTGDYVCTVCGQTTETGTAIPKLVNKALDATASTNATFWAVVGNGSWAPNSIPNINDGDLATGANTMDGNLREIKYILTWESAVDVDKVVVVCNGTGNLGYKGNVTDTNYACAITINVYGENGEVIKTVSDTTADKDQIEIAFETTTKISKIEVSLANNYNQAEGAIFEIMAIAAGTTSTEE